MSPESSPVQAHSDISKGRITGFCKRSGKIHRPMTGAVITADLAIAQAKSSVAGIRIILVGIRIFPNIFQCRHNFKGRTRRIQSLCSPVDQYGTGIVIYQILPYFSDGIGIKIRMGYHGKNLPGRHFGYNNGTAIDIQLIICHLLNFNIQCSVNIIPGILFPAVSFFTLLLKEVFVLIK